MTNNGNDKVFIVFYCEARDQTNHYIESVWSSRELAQAAIHYHANSSKTKFSDFRIVERDVNKASIRG